MQYWLNSGPANACDKCLRRPDEHSMRVLKTAIQTGQLACTEWILNSYPKWQTDQTVCLNLKYSTVRACQSGHLTTLQYLHDKHICHIDTIYSREAVREGYLDILNWLLECGQLYDTQLCTEAIRYNQRATFDWLVANGVTPDSADLITAIECKDELFFRYMLEAGVPLTAQAAALMDHEQKMWLPPRHLLVHDSVPVRRLLWCGTGTTMAAERHT